VKAVDRAAMKTQTQTVCAAQCSLRPRALSYISKHMSIP